MKEQPTSPQRVKKLIEDLRARDERKVIGALKRVPHEGTPEMIKPMLQLLATDPSSDIQLLLEKSLFNLKDPKAIDPMCAALRDEEFRGIRAHILTCIWQSGLDVSEELGLLVDIAISDDYMTGIEVLTIIDNQEVFLDDLISENIKKLDKATEQKSDKSALLGNLRQVLLEKLLGD